MQFTLPDIPVNIHLGVTDEEQKEPQKILISLVWKADTQNVETSDKLEDTINYSAVRQWVMDWGKEQSFATIEKCLAELLQDVQRQFIDMKNVHATLTKFPHEEFVMMVEK